MKLKSLAYILMIGFISLLAGCDDEDSAFSGSENYITSFSLKLQDGKTYAATITEEPKLRFCVVSLPRLPRIRRI